MIVPYGKGAGSDHQSRGCIRPRLRAVRQSRALSQNELGAKSGYHRTYIGQLERGEKSPSLRTLFNLAVTLGMSPSAIVRKVEQSLRA